MGAFDEAFPTDQARELVRRLEFCYTPKHGSWLNIAENELSALTRQCLSGCRFGELESLRQATEAWSVASNKRQRGVDWQFKIDDARTKLNSLYPENDLWEWPNGLGAQLRLGDRPPAPGQVSSSGSRTPEVVGTVPMASPAAPC